MFDAFAHLDLTADDPVADITVRLNASGGADALLVETWKGEDFQILDALRTSRQSRFRLAFCLRQVQPAVELLTDPSVFGIRVRGSEMALVRDLVSTVGTFRKCLLAHSDQGIGPLTDQVVRILAEHPGLNVYFPHLGWPIADGREDPDWRRSLRQLRSISTVSIGISAIEHFSNERFPHPDVKLYAREILKSFDPHRIVAGSDYPLFDKKRYTDYMKLARSWIREVYPEWQATGTTVWRA